MKRIMFILILVSSLWSEEIKIDDIYEVYISKTVDIDISKATREEIYFGEYSAYVEKTTKELQDTMIKNVGNGAVSGLSAVANSTTNNVANGMGKSLGQGLGMGLGIGLVMGVIDIGVQKAIANEVYILIYDYTNEKGEKTRVSAFYVAEDFDDEPIVKTYLEEQINKKYMIKG